MYNSPDIQTLSLNNGITLPMLGFGVNKMPDDHPSLAVTDDLQAIYRSKDVFTITLATEEIAPILVLETDGHSRSHPREFDC